MKEQDRNREEQLTRLFETTGLSSIPSLEPDPSLPTRVRALARAEDEARERIGRAPRWVWAPLAGAVFALSLFAGGYIGYRAWAVSEQAALDRSTDRFMTAWSQSGFFDDLSLLGSDEVAE